MQSRHTSREHLERRGTHNRCTASGKPGLLWAMHEFLHSNLDLPVNTLNSKCSELGDVGDLPHLPFVLTKKPFEVAFIL